MGNQFSSNGWRSSFPVPQVGLVACRRLVVREPPERAAQLRIVLAVNFAIAGAVFFVSAANERRLLSHPTIPVLSQRWSAWTKVDDPDYKRKLAAYHKNKKPLWERILPDAVIQDDHGHH